MLLLLFSEMGKTEKPKEGDQSCCFKGCRRHGDAGRNKIHIEFPPKKKDEWRE